MMREVKSDQDGKKVPGDIPIARLFFYFRVELLFYREDIEGHGIGVTALQSELHLPDGGLRLARNRHIAIVFGQPGQERQIDLGRHEAREQDVQDSNALVNSGLLIGARGGDLDLT